MWTALLLVRGECKDPSESGSQWVRTCPPTTMARPWPWHPV